MDETNGFLHEDELASTVVGADVVCPTWTSDTEKYPAEASAYDLLSEVGHGATATVWSARARGCGEYIAVKMFFLDHMKEDKGRAVQEVLTMRSLRHPAILPVLAHFQEDDHMWMVTPFVNGGSAESILTQRHSEGLTETGAVGVAYPVLQALSFMHQLSLMHRDVKAANVLVSDEGKVYLADMGVVAPVRHVSGSTHNHGSPERERVRARHAAVVSTFTGTPAWMAPEVVAPDEEVGYDERADVWSFGILLLELAQGAAPHEEESLKNVVMSITNGEPPQLQEPTDGREFSQAFREVVRQCLQKDPASRASAVQLLKHPLFKAPIEGRKLVHELFAMEEKKMPRVPSRSKSMAQRGLQAVLKEEVQHALELLRKATAPEPSCEKGGKGEEQRHHHLRHRLIRHHPHPASRISQQDLAACKGLVFGRAHKAGRGVASVAHGTGFAMARHVNEAGELFWSAPAFLHVVGHGVGIAVGAEELGFVLVLRDYDHLLTAAAAETAVRANVSQSLVGHRVALAIRLGNGNHTAKLVSFADGRMFDMSILGWNLGPDAELNERVYGEKGNDADPSTILDGGARPPTEFDALIDELQGLENTMDPLRISSERQLASDQQQAALGRPAGVEANGRGAVGERGAAGAGDD